MPLLIENIVERNMLDGAKIVAGQQGMGNKILWVNLMEILDMPNSLQAGELLVTTGYRMDDEHRHRGLIDRLKSRGVSGIAIQPGYYIDAIPPYIIDSANAQGFPVIELPKELTFSHIMHVLLARIDTRKKSSVQTELSALQSEFEQACEDGLQAEQEVQIFLATPSFANATMSGALLKKSLQKLKSCVQGCCGEAKLLLSQHYGLLVVSVSAEYSSQDAVFALSRAVAQLQQQQVNLLVGGGAITQGKAPASAFDEAAQSAKTLRNIEAKRGVCPYENKGLFELLGGIHKNTQLVLSAYEMIGKLLETDRQNNSAYTQTLRMYLAHECGMTETADHLFIHRHTLKNRLAKITAICGYDLKNYYERLHLSMALLLHDCFD